MTQPKTLRTMAQCAALAAVFAFAASAFAQGDGTILPLEAPAHDRGTGL